MSRIKPWHILLAGWALFAIYAYPGLMTRDSYDQLVAARAGMFSGAHPTLMQGIWSVLDTFVAGPFGIVVLDTTMFVAGAYSILRRVLTPRAAAATAVGLLLFPPIGAVMAVAWNECLMAGFLMLGIALVLGAKRVHRVAGGILLCAAIGASSPLADRAAHRPDPAAVLGFGESWSRKLIVTHDYQNASELRELGLPTGYSKLQHGVGAIYEAVSETVLFRPYLYAALGLVLLALGRRQRDVLALLGSGFAAEALVLLFGKSPDYRVSHWLVVSVCLAGILVGVRRYQTARAARDIAAPTV